MLPTTCLRFYLLVTSSLLDMFSGVPEFPIPSLLMWISSVLLQIPLLPVRAYILVLQSPAQGSTLHSHCHLISLVLCADDFWPCLPQPLFPWMSRGHLCTPPCAYLLYLHTFHSIVFGLRVRLPSQTMCFLWTGTLSYQLPQCLSPNETHTTVPISVYATESSEHKDFLQRFWPQRNT